MKNHIVIYGILLMFLAAGIVYAQTDLKKKDELAYHYKQAGTAKSGKTIPPLTKQQEKALTWIIAEIYGLTPPQTCLLLAIRDHEAGRPGKEFGVEKSSAKTFRDGRRSFLVQCAYAAETVARRCPDVNDDDLRRFNHGDGHYKGYSEDPNWWKKVKGKMRKYLDMKEKP